METNIVNIRKFLLVLTAAIILSACDKESTPTDDIVGTWTSGTSTFTFMVGTQSLSEYLTSLGYTASDSQFYLSLFNLGMQQSFTGTIQLKGDNTYISNLGGVQETGTWSLTTDTKKIILDPDDAQAMVFDIITLTANKLQVQMTGSIGEDLDDDTVPEEIIVNVDLTFNK